MNSNGQRAVFFARTAICGVVIVTSETPQNLLFLVIWGAGTINIVRRIRRRSGNRPAMGIAACHMATMAAIIAAAALAPVKRVDAVLAQTVELDCDQMTVAQLADFCSEHRRSLPLTIYIPSGGPAAESQIQFSNRSMSLQQFIADVERQTGCHHHFSGCGNAYTVLYGNACSFGLSFTPPPDSGLEWR